MLENVVPISILAYPRCVASNVTGLVDMMYAANHVASEMLHFTVRPFAVQVLSADGAAVESASGYSLAVDGDWSRQPLGGTVVVPAVGPEYVLTAIADNRAMMRWLVHQHAQGATLAASGTAPALLAAAGLLDGREATASWWIAEELQKRFPKVRLRPEAMLTEADRIICTGAGVTFPELALALIRRYAGEQVAAVTAKGLAIEERRSQAPYMAMTRLYDRDLLAVRAEGWVREHLGEPVGVAELADAMAMSARSLHRAFKQNLGLEPSAFIRRVRLHRARQLLESTGLPVAAVREQVGYQDASAFSRLFKQQTGLTPAEYRRRFQP